MKASKKLRAWYRTYCEQKKELGERPFPIGVWAVIEEQRCGSTPRGKELRRFLAKKWR